MTRAPALAAALDDFFAAYYRHNPVSATFTGIHDHDDRLPDYSARGMDDAASQWAAIRRRVRALPAEPLTEAEALDRALLDGILDILAWEDASAHFHRGNPCLYTGEAVFGVMALFLRDLPAQAGAQRIEAAIARMRAVPRLLAEGQANLRRVPRPWIERAVRECIGARAFFETGTELLIRDHAIRDPRFRDAAAAAAAAFAGFRSHLEGTLAPAAHEDCGCGGEAFDLLLRRGHFLEMDAAAVRAGAREEIARCEADLAAGAAEFGAGSWREALAQLAGRHPAAELYYARFAEVWEEMRRAAVAHRLLTWPEYPIRYVPQPAWARAAAPSLYFLAYRSPAPYDRLPTVDYLVPPVDPEMPPDEQARRLRATNDSVIKLNHVIHHGGIGHHVQNWHAQRAASRIGQVAAVDCAGRIALFCGGTMAEGWACYATDLMEEIGCLTPLERYAQVHARLRMAVRGLVDVDLHHGALTVDAAAAVYQERAGVAPEAARAEAVKNSMFPGTAMMYSAGRNLIHGLRRDLAAAHPGRFDLRGFHDRFLAHGSVPVALVSAAMRKAYARV